MKKLHIFCAIFILSSCSNQDSKLNEISIDSVANEEKNIAIEQKNNHIKIGSCSWYDEKMQTNNTHVVKIDTLKSTAQYKLCGNQCGDNDVYKDYKLTTNGDSYILKRSDTMTITDTWQVITDMEIIVEDGYLTKKQTSTNMMDGTTTVTNPSDKYYMTQVCEINWQ